MFWSCLSLGSFASFIAYATTAPTPSLPRVRLPPSLDPLANTSSYPPFALPPPNWSAGNWKVTYTSSASYAVLLNMQFDSYPVLPTCHDSQPQLCAPGTFPGQLVDLTSFNLPNTTADGPNPNPDLISTAFGYDTPRRLNDPSLGPGWDGVYDFQGTGAFDTMKNSYEIIAWGEDKDGYDWWVLYETPATGASLQPAAMSVESRAETGPSTLILNLLRTSLKLLGNGDLTAMLDGLKKVEVDGRRIGQPPVICDATCQLNEDIFMG